MEERHGIKGFTQDDVFFTESSIDKFVYRGQIFIIDKCF